MFNVSNNFNSVERNLKKLGFMIETGSSNLSSSRYITVLRHESDVDYENDSFPIKIRISHHELPISYARSDLDINPMGIDWRSAVKQVCELADIETPKLILTSIARQEKINEENRLKSIEANRLAALEAKSNQDFWDTKLVEFGYPANISGKARKNAKTKIKNKLN